MKTVFTLAPALLGVVLLSLGGCEARDCDDTKKVETNDQAKNGKEDGACLEFVSTKTWRGEDVEFRGDYESGKNVSIDNSQGEITVKRTDRDDVLVTFKPFVARAHDICDGEEITSGDRCQAIDDDLADQELTLEEDDGNYLIQARRDDSVISLGADIEVELPDTFNGRLSIKQNNGETNVFHMGDAAAVILQSGLGDCSIETGGAPLIDIRCESGVTNVAIGAITPGDDVRQIYKTDEDLGELLVSFPSTDEPFSVSALSAGDAVTIKPADPSGCDVLGDDPRSVTVACNGATDEDPVYTVRSDQDIVPITIGF